MQEAQPDMTRLLTTASPRSQSSKPANTRAHALLCQRCACQLSTAVVSSCSEWDDRGLRGRHRNLNIPMVEARVRVSFGVRVKGRGPCRDWPD